MRVLFQLLFYTTQTNLIVSGIRLLVEITNEQVVPCRLYMSGKTESLKLSIRLKDLLLLVLSQNFLRRCLCFFFTGLKI